MPEFSISHDVAHGAQAMFDLVADVEKYPQFVPLCQDLRLRGIQDLEDGGKLMVADMTVAYGPMRETFTTRINLSPKDLAIKVVYLDGPFKHLDNRWVFAPLGESSSAIDFYIDYEFKSRVLSTVMGSVFDKAFRKFIDAFERRADDVYGPSANDAKS
jgi:coenzyme Q-binding protein COQ10